MQVTPLSGLDIASGIGVLIVYAGFLFAVAAAIAAAGAFFGSSAIRRDQWASTSRALLTFALGLVLIGALLLIAVPAIQTADPARLPPTPTATPSPSPTPTPTETPTPTATAIASPEPASPAAGTPPPTSSPTPGPT